MSTLFQFTVLPAHGRPSFVARTAALPDWSDAALVSRVALCSAAAGSWTATPPGVSPVPGPAVSSARAATAAAAVTLRLAAEKPSRRRRGTARGFSARPRDGLGGRPGIHQQAGTRAARRVDRLGVPGRRSRCRQLTADAANWAHACRRAAPRGRVNPGRHSFVHHGQTPPRGRVGGDRSEHVGLVTPHRQVRDRLTAVGKHHRQVKGDPDLDHDHAGAAAAAPTPRPCAWSGPSRRRRRPAVGTRRGRRHPDHRR
jgi:hypothetical protein